jgi:hypothetical protein
MQVVLVKARLHDFVYVFDWNLLKENFVKSIPFTPSQFGQSFYPKLPFGGKFKDKQNGWIRGIHGNVFLNVVHNGFTAQNFEDASSLNKKAVVKSVVAADEI